MVSTRDTAPRIGGKANRTVLCGNIHHKAAYPNIAVLADSFCGVYLCIAFSGELAVACCHGDFQLNDFLISSGRIGYGHSLFTKTTLAIPVPCSSKEEILGEETIVKIAYLLWYDVAHETGVIKKVANQVRSWQRHGHTPQLFAMGDCREIWSGANDIPHQVFGGHSLFQRIRKSREVVEAIRKWNPDVVYFRFSAYYPAMENLLNDFPFVLEVNTDDVSEFRRSLPYPLYLYHRLTRERVLRKAAGIVSVTPELSNMLPRVRAKKTVISNGILLDDYSQLDLRNAVRQTRLAFVGTPQRDWHGVDQILRMAQRLPHWQFDIVGYQPTNARVPSNVKFYGFLSPIAYHQILGRADAAIGSLALYRNSLRQGCALKVREYLACGLPTIVGYDDVDFPTPVPHLLQLNTSVSGIEEQIPAIDNFIARWRTKRVAVESIAHLNLDLKESKRLDFFHQIA
ncbi:MAG: glycosyltransferase involved in cell wall biosynthesis [Pirellulaceae bacterium]|jgi:glycosyltransferase involved in cell wall biosynthesis